MVLTPGPGIYFNAFIRVYSPRAGADYPLGTNVDVNRKPLSLCPFVPSFKTISTHFFHVFSHVYSPGQEQTNPWDQNFNVNRKALSFWSFVDSFEKIPLNSDFIHIFYVLFFYPRGKGRQTLGVKILMSTERPSLFDHLLQVLKKSLWSLILMFYACV